MANVMGDNIWEGPLGVVQLEFDGVDLGLTMEDTTLEFDQDIKDVLYQQYGTKASDKVRTGIIPIVKCKIAEITTTRLDTVFSGFTLSGSGNAVKIGRELYRSMKDYEAKVLRIQRVDSEGVVTTDDDHIMVFYKAIPIVTGTIDWGADTQRGLSIEFHCMWDEDETAFGYTGKASSVGLNPAA